MKKILFGIIIIGIVLGAFYFLNKKEEVLPVDIVPVEKNTKSKIDVEQGEFCYAKFGTPNNDGYYDKYTLRLILSGKKATGELNLLPAEKDIKTGEIKGVVSVFDKVSKTRTADLEWFTFMDGISTEKVKIILGKNMASVKQGTSTLNLPELPCLDLIKRTNVENYLIDNISELSPVKAVLGGTWYVLYATINLEKNSGTVVYEDGHIEEKKNFSFSTNEKGEVISLTIN